MPDTQSFQTRSGGRQPPENRVTQGADAPRSAWFATTSKQRCILWRLGILTLATATWPMMRTGKDRLNLMR